MGFGVKFYLHCLFTEYKFNSCQLSVYFVKLAVLIKTEETVL
jgi:hypothetical protein